VRIRTILVVGFLLRLAHAFVTPAWQAPDEFPHYWVAQQWAASGRLPAGSPDFPAYEAYQHPLYYLLVGEGLAITGAGHLSYADEPAPVPLLIVRIFSAILGTAIVALTWLFARRIRPDRPDTAWMAAAFAALLPSFVGVSSTVNNDILAIALSSASLALPLPAGGRKSGLALVATGLLAGGALATKLNTLVVLPPLLLLLWRSEGMEFTLRRAALLLPGILLGVSGVVVRNLLSYGTVVALPLPAGEPSFTVPATLHAMRNLFWSFWMAFGRTYENHPGAWVYLATALPLTLLGAFGWWRSRREGRARREIVLIILSLLIGLAASLFFTLRSPEGTQTSWGKNLYPLLPLIAYTLAFGWGEALPGARRTLPIAALALCAAGSLWPLFL
jgi:hypothetical protein